MRRSRTFEEFRKRPMREPEPVEKHERHRRAFVGKAAEFGVERQVEADAEVSRRGFFQGGVVAAEKERADSFQPCRGGSFRGMKTSPGYTGFL
jgi:hypothetical protein